MNYEFQDLANRLFATFGCPLTIAAFNDQVLGMSVQPEHLIDAARSALWTRKYDAASRYVNIFTHQLSTPARLEGSADLNVLARYIVPPKSRGRVNGFIHFIDPDGRVDTTTLQPFADEIVQAGDQIELDWLT